MKKLIKNIYIAVCLLGLTSCEKWLDVKPIDRVTDESLFKDGVGYQNALNGIYQYMSEGALYGRNLSWGLYSALSQDYLNTDISAELQSAGYTYPNADLPAVINLGNTIWSNAYRAIANSNKLINEIKKADTSIFRFGQSEKDLIKGEAIAIRGLMHFELLRLFAPAPKDQPEGKYIPYVNTYPSYYNAPQMTKDVIANILADLDSAQNLVATHDTITIPTGITSLQSRMVGSNAPAERFYSSRMNRLNFVAIAGLKAKVAMYGGDIDKAKQYAEYVYNYGPQGTKKYFAFTSSTNSTGVNKYIKFADDILFASYNRDLLADIDAYKGTSLRYRLNRAVSSTWLPSNVRDYRQNLLRADASTTTDFVSDKWLLTTSTSSLRPEQNYIIPVLRMSEIYYIYSEALFKQGDITKALSVLNYIRYSIRGRQNVFSTTDENAFYAELLDEYRREFLVEGQTIWAHKRLGKPMQITTVTIPMDSRFTFRIPEGELIF